jgi:hypothetical protein
LVFSDHRTQAEALDSDPPSSDRVCLPQQWVRDVTGKQSGQCGDIAWRKQLATISIIDKLQIATGCGRDDWHTTRHGL